MATDVKIVFVVSKHFIKHIIKITAEFLKQHTCASNVFYGLNSYYLFINFTPLQNKNTEFTDVCILNNG